MSSSTFGNRAAVEVLFTKLLLAVAKYVITPISVGGSTQSAAQISATLQACLTAARDLDAARTAYETQLVAYRAAYGAAHTLAVAIFAYARAAYGVDSPILSEFGLVPHARVKPDTSTLAQAQAKAKATRAARHTMGSKQKAEIVGTVTNGAATPALKA